MKNYWKRWIIILNTSFDNLINRVENHEALINASISEAQTAVNKANLKLACVKRDGERMEQRISDLSVAITDWERRAQLLAEQDHDRAIACLRRRNHAQEEISHLTEELSQHQLAVQALTRNITKLEQHITELKRRKNTLSARDHCARAASLTPYDNDRLLSNVDAIFERWELKIAENGITSTVSHNDPFEEEFISQEENSALEAELATLKQQSPSA